MGTGPGTMTEEYPECAGPQCWCYDCSLDSVTETEEWDHYRDQCGEYHSDHIAAAAAYAEAALTGYTSKHIEFSERFRKIHSKVPDPIPTMTTPAEAIVESLTPLVRYAKQHATIISDPSVTEQQLLQMFVSLFKLPTTLMVPAEVKAPKVRGGAKGLEAKAQQRWLTLGQYLKEKGSVCAYMANTNKGTGQKDRVCAAPPVLTEGLLPEQLRCSICKGKKGIISRELLKLPASKDTVPLTSMQAALSLMPSAAPPLLAVSSAKGLAALAALVKTPVVVKRGPSVAVLPR